MENKSHISDRVAPPLPATAADFIKARKFQLGRNLNDLVEDVHLQLVENETYRKFLYAIDDSGTVEGSLSTDNVFAAKMIREKATELGNFWEVESAKIATIVRRLGVVLRRYGQDRKTRRLTVDGVVVSNGEGDHD